MSEQPASSYDLDNPSEPNFYRAKKGLMSWLFTVDHKRLGVMYLASVILFFFVAGVLAIALRTDEPAKAPLIDDDQAAVLARERHGARV